MMSQHRSFGRSSATQKVRSVLKRYEKIEMLSKAEKWTEDSSVYGLPKVKVLRIKAKKEKPKAAEDAEGAAADTAKTEASKDAKPAAKK